MELLLWNAICLMDYRQVLFYTRDMFLKNSVQIKHRISI